MRDTEEREQMTKIHRARSPLGRRIKSLRGQHDEIYSSVRCDRYPTTAHCYVSPTSETLCDLNDRPINALALQHFLFQVPTPLPTPKQNPQRNPARHSQPSHMHASSPCRTMRSAHASRIIAQRCIARREVFANLAPATTYSAGGLPERAGG